MSKFDQLLRENKELIKYGNLYQLEENYQTLKPHTDFSRLFKELFIQACFYNQRLVADWLYREIYLKLPIMAQIGLRPVFNYCHHLAVKRKYIDLAQELQLIQREVKKSFL